MGILSCFLFKPHATQRDVGCGDKSQIFGYHLECGAHHRRVASDNQSLLVKLLKFNFICAI